MDPRRILVVDDERVVRDVLRRSLELKGCETREAANARELLPVVDDGWNPDVIFLDIVMPGKSGLELIAEMKERFPEAAIVMMTSYASVDVVQRALRSGAQDFLSKPFTVSEAWAAVDRALAEHNPPEDDA